MARPEEQLVNGDVVEVTPCKQSQRDENLLQKLPSEVLEHLLEWTSPNDAFALLPLPGAIYRLFYHPEATASLQIKLLGICQQTMDRPFWTLFNDPALPNATKLMMAAQYSQSVGLTPSHAALQSFIERTDSDAGPHGHEKELIAQLVWSYKKAETASLSGKPIDLAYAKVTTLLSRSTPLYEHLNYPEIDFVAQHWHELDEAQQQTLTELLHKNIKITEGSHHLIPLIRPIELSFEEHCRIKNEMIRIIPKGGYGYQFLHWFFILPSMQQDEIVGRLKNIILMVF
ncbi:hypothetical protein [Legionella tunisiensis]|uniref:hypothetical protein n=1 Tax=Legionella tunisiensis TaxID=1034944 RepID=UPI0002E85CEC|nr:hypothetical protein [Legionella tunisiensis]